MPIINPNNSPTQGTAIGRGSLDPNNPYNNATGRDGMLQWMTWEKQHNPSYQIPNGYTLDNGNVVREQPNFLMTHAWLIPLMGIGAGAAASALAGGGAAAAGAAGGDAAGSMFAAGGPEAAGAASSAVNAGVAGSAAGGSGLTAGSLFRNIGALSQLAGTQARDSALGRLSQVNAQNGYDRNALDFYNSGVRNALTTPPTLARNAAFGDALSNVQSTKFSGLPSYVSMPQISGGLSPDLLGPNSRQAGRILSRNALLNLANNQFNLPQAPTQTPLPTPSALDTGMGTFARIASIASLLNQGQGHSGDYNPFTDPSTRDPYGNFLGTTDNNGIYVPGIYG